METRDVVEKPQFGNIFAVNADNILWDSEPIGLVKIEEAHSIVQAIKDGYPQVEI